MKERSLVCVNSEWRENSKSSFNDVFVSKTDLTNFLDLKFVLFKYFILAMHFLHWSVHIRPSYQKYLNNWPRSKIKYKCFFTVKGLLQTKYSGTRHIDDNHVQTCISYTQCRALISTALNTLATNSQLGFRLAITATI